MTLLLCGDEGHDVGQILCDALAKKKKVVTLQNGRAGFKAIFWVQKHFFFFNGLGFRKTTPFFSGFGNTTTVLYL